jgi:hypothetical protein
VLGTFDDVIDHQSVGQMDLFVGAQPVGREILILRAAIDRKGLLAKIEPHDILLLDIADPIRLDPFTHSRFLKSAAAVLGFAGAK